MATSRPVIEPPAAPARRDPRRPSARRWLGVATGVAALAGVAGLAAVFSAPRRAASAAFDNAASESPAPGKDAAPSAAPSSAEARLRSLSPAEKQALAAKQKRFENLPPAERDRLRALHAELERHPRGEQLRQVLAAYHAWLMTLPAGQRAELLALPAETRLARVKELRARAAAPSGEWPWAVQLPAEDLRALQRWVASYAANHEAELLAALPPEARRRFESIVDDEARRRLLLLALRRPLAPQVPAPTPDELRALRDGLSPATRGQLDAASGDERRRLTQKWIVAAITHQALAAVPAVELRRFFAEELSADERARLEDLPPEWMMRELRRRYFVWKWQDFDGPRWPGAKPPGGPLEPRGPRGDRLKPPPENRPPR